MVNFGTGNSPSRNTNSFAHGRIVATRGALEALSSDEITVALNRHLRCDWGELDPEDLKANERALEFGGRLFSAYCTEAGTRFWIITEADWSATTVLLPEEY